MLKHIHSLITLDKPSGESGKIILIQRNDGFEVQWNVWNDGQEQAEIHYTGPDLEQAWRAMEAVRHAKSKEGYLIYNPFITYSLTAIPSSYLFVRKLECFAAKHMQPALFDELKKWRKSAASAANLPPYFIGTDKMLSLLATYIPQTEEELLQIPGIGKNKLEQYGQGILQITKKFPPAYPFPLDWVQESVSQEELAAWLLDEKLVKEEKRQIRLKQEKEEKMRLLEAIHDLVSINEAADRLSVSVSQLIYRIRELAKEGYDVLPYLDREVERITEKDLIQDVVSSLGTNRLKPIFEKLYGKEEGISSKDKGEKYNRIRLVCTYLQLKNVS